MTAGIRGALVRAAAAGLLLTVIAGLPGALIRFVGWPLPSHVPTAENLSGWLSTPTSDQTILNILAVAAWLLWSAFLSAVTAEARAAWHGLPTAATTGHTINPLRLGAAALITALTLGAAPGLMSPALTATPIPAGAATQNVAALNSNPNGPATSPVIGSGEDGSLGEGTAILLVGANRYSHVVEPGDTLSKIARTWLSDAERWPEICRLNKHRHWREAGGTLRDCDLIYPGWRLRLPPDASAPPQRAARHAAPPESPSRPATSPPVPAAPDGHAANVKPTAASSPTTASPTIGADASSPAPATPTIRPQGSSGSGTESATTASKAASTQPIPIISGPAAAVPTTRTPTAGPSLTGPPATTPSASPAATSPTETAAPHDVPSAQRASSDRDGVQVAGGWIPWSLAGGIAAAIALVWLQRRRRHLPGATDDDPTDLPATVLEVKQLVSRNPDLPALAADLGERASEVPPVEPLPAGGMGLIGDGAQAAARAALTAVLASGGPREPDAQGEVVIDGSTLTTLIGADAAGLGPWPRLQVADDPDHALTLIEEHLLRRSRILDENEASDLSALRRDKPAEEPLPPILLITETPPAGTRMRARTTLGLAAGLDITALLLGEWTHGPTLDVEVDGHTHPQPGTHAPDGVPTRLGVLDSESTVAVLATLREAHTGQRPAIIIPSRTHASPTAIPTVLTVLTDPAATPQTSQDSNQDVQHRDSEHRDPGDPGDGDSAAAHESGSAAGEPGNPPAAEPGLAASVLKARLNVFGSPRIEDIEAPGQPLRAKARELAVFLACHPEGVDTRAIGDHLEPDVRLRHADTRVHTNVSNLRHVLGRAAGPRRIGYVTKTSGKYQLDRASVDVDLWQFEDLIARAATASARQRIRLLRQACDLYTAPLAEACDYDWVEAHRERARQHATDAHLLLAETIMPTGPLAACDILDRAIGLDRYNEGLYRAGMHARHQVGDRDGIRTLLRALTTAMSDLDTEPAEATIELAQHLRTQPSTPPSNPDPTPGAISHPDEGVTTPQAAIAVLTVLSAVAATAALAAGIPDLSSAWPASTRGSTMTGYVLTLAVSIPVVFAFAWWLATRRRSGRAQPGQAPAIPATVTDAAGEPDDLTQSQRLSMWARLVLVPVAAIGAVLSFRSLYLAAVPTFGPYLAAGFPLLVDLLILGSSLQYVAGAKIGRPMTGWRLTAHAGVAATLTLNALAAYQVGQIPWHVTAPAVWAILVELTAQQVVGQWKATHTGRLDVIPLSLWLTAPIESTRTRLLMLRTATGDARAARIAVGHNAAAREVVLLSLPTRRDHRTRRVIHRQLRAGSLEPAAILKPLGWTLDTTPDLGPTALHRPNLALLAAVLQDVLAPSAARTPESLPDPPTWANPPSGPTEPEHPTMTLDTEESAVSGRDTIAPEHPTSTPANQNHPIAAKLLTEDASAQSVRPDPDPATRTVSNDVSSNKRGDPPGPSPAEQPAGTAATTEPKREPRAHESPPEPSSESDDAPQSHPAFGHPQDTAGARRQRTAAGLTRLDQAIRIVREQPSISGTDLATALGTHGWRVSPRTGQRLLAQIQTMPAATPAPGRVAKDLRVAQPL